MKKIIKNLNFFIRKLIFKFIHIFWLDKDQNVVAMGRKGITKLSIYTLILSFLVFYQLYFFGSTRIVLASSCPPSAYCPFTQNLCPDLCPSSYKSGSTCYYDLDNYCCYSGGVPPNCGTKASAGTPGYGICGYDDACTLAPNSCTSNKCAYTYGTCSSSGCGTRTAYCPEGKACSPSSGVCDATYCAEVWFCDSERYVKVSKWTCDGFGECAILKSVVQMDDCGAPYCSNICTKIYKCSDGSCGTFTRYAGWDEICSNGAILPGSCGTDGCYAYGNGCEMRDYGCSSGSCTYTYSNRHTDTSCSYTSCSADKCDKIGSYTDYYCDGGSCTGHSKSCSSPCPANKYCSGGSCVSGPCGTSSCPSDTCSGSCPGCFWKDYPSSCNRYCDGNGNCASCSCSYTSRDPDSSSTYCTGCGETWVSSVSKCCGDDAGEDWCAGGYKACYNEVYYTNGDSNSYTCNCGGGTWLVGKCCGDDSGEDYTNPGTGNSACVNANAIAHDNVDSTQRYLVYNGLIYYCVEAGGSGESSPMLNVNPGSSVGSWKCEQDGIWRGGTTAIIPIRGGRIKIV